MLIATRRYAGLAMLVGLVAILACARVRPLTGGPADETPPELLQLNPRDSSVAIPRQPVFEFNFDERIDPASAKRALRFYPATRRPRFDIKNKQMTITFADSLPADTTLTLVIGEALQDPRPRNNKLESEQWFVFSTGPTLHSAALFGHVARKGKSEPQGVVLFAPVVADSLRDPHARYPVAAANSEGLFRMLGVPPNQPFILKAFWDRNDNLHLDDTELVSVYPDTLILEDGEVRRGLRWNLIDPNAPAEITGIAVHQTDFTAPIVIAFRLQKPPRPTDEIIQTDSVHTALADSFQTAEADSALDSTTDVVVDSLPLREARADTLRPLALPVAEREESNWRAAWEQLEPKGYLRSSWKTAFASPRGHYSVRLLPGTYDVLAFIDVSGDSVPGLYVTADSTLLEWEPLMIGAKLVTTPGDEIKLKTLEIR